MRWRMGQRLSAGGREPGGRGEGKGFFLSLYTRPPPRPLGEAEGEGMVMEEKVGIAADRGVVGGEGVELECTLHVAEMVCTQVSLHCGALRIA